MPSNSPKPPDPTVEKIKTSALNSAERFLNPIFADLFSFANKFGRDGKRIMQETIKNQFNFIFNSKRQHIPEEIWNEIRTFIAGEFVVAFVAENIKKRVSGNELFQQNPPDEEDNIWAYLVPLEDEEITHDLFGFSEPLRPNDVLEIIFDAIDQAFPPEAQSLATELKESLRENLNLNDIDPESIERSHEFLHNIVLPTILSLSDEYFLAESNSRRQLPEKLRIENFKPEETLLDKTVAKFSESVNGPLSQNILIQQDVYNDAHTKNAVRARSKNNLLVKEVLGGKLLSIPVLDAMRTNINDLLGDDYLEDNNDLIDHLAQINTLERFLSPVNLPTDFDFSNPEDVEKIKIGLIQIFEDGIREAFKNSPQQNLVESMLSVLQNAVADFLQENDFDTDDGLETFVAYILGHMEDFGNLVFLQTYEETKRILPTKNTPRK